MDELDSRDAGLFRARRSILARREFQVPTLQKILLAVLGHPLTTVGVEVQLALTADVGEVGRDGTGRSPAAGDFHHDLGCPPYGAPDLLDLRR